MVGTLYQDIHKAFRLEEFLIVFEDKYIENSHDVLIAEKDPVHRGGLQSGIADAMPVFWNRDSWHVELVEDVSKGDEAVLDEIVSKIDQYDTIILGPDYEYLQPNISAARKQSISSLTQALDEQGIGAKRKEELTAKLDKVKALRVIPVSSLDILLDNIYERLESVEGERHAFEAAKTQLDDVVKKMRAGEYHNVAGLLYFDDLLTTSFDTRVRSPVDPISKGVPVRNGVGVGFPVHESQLEEFMADPRYASTKIILLSDGVPSISHRHADRIAGIITKKEIGKGSHDYNAMVIYGIPVISNCHFQVGEQGFIIGSHAVPSDTELSMSGNSGRVYQGNYVVLESRIIQDARVVAADKMHTSSEETVAYKSFVDLAAHRIRARGGMQLYAFAPNIRTLRMADALATGTTESMLAGVGMIKSESMFDSFKRKELLFRYLTDPTDKKAEEAVFKMHYRTYRDILGFNTKFPVQARGLDSLGEIFSGYTPEQGEQQRVQDFHTTSPTDWRGPTIAFEFPHLYALQMKALMKAVNETGNKNARFILPYVSSFKEARLVHQLLDKVAREVHMDQDYKPAFGVMLETQAGLQEVTDIYDKAGARHYAIGTNDLTANVLNLPRRSTRAMVQQLRRGIYDENPFEILQARVMAAIDPAVAFLANQTDVTFGVTGRHAAVLEDMRYLDKRGMHYIAITPTEIPEAIVHLAQTVESRVKG